jgi:transcriptional repressor NrdR
MGVSFYPHTLYGYPLAFLIAVCQYIDMFCINCFHSSTNVGNSRPHKKQPLVWRRRSCPQCGTVFTTTERPSLAHTQKVHLPSGESTSFNLGKLIISLSKAIQHNPSEAEFVTLELAQTIETILLTEIKTITPEDIEVIAHQVLKRYDELAAMQYAAQHQLVTSLKKRGRPSLRERGPRTDESPSR